MQGTPTATSLAFSFHSFQGSRRALESSRCRLQRRNPQRKCSEGEENEPQVSEGEENEPQVTIHFELKPPPYPLDALEPYMSSETLEYHWGKHHRGYVDNLNTQITGSGMEELALEDIITHTYNKGNILPAFNNAAQIWNHDFFWESMKPGGGGKPSGELLELIERDFGSCERFLADFKAAASTQFGSGWAWLAYKANRLNVGNAVNPQPKEEDKKLLIVKSTNAVNPLVWDYSPILTIDVWEHAYYLDYENRRADFFDVFMEKLVSWEAVSLRLEVAKARALERELKEQRDNGSFTSDGEGEGEGEDEGEGEGEGEGEDLVLNSGIEDSD